MNSKINITFLDFEDAHNILFDILGIDSKMKVMSPDGICHLIKKSNISDPELYNQCSQSIMDCSTLNFLDIIMNGIGDEEMVVMITHESYNLEKVFYADWKNMKDFCDQVYENLFSGINSFVQEHDYIFLIPKRRKIHIFNHNLGHSVREF